MWGRLGGLDGHALAAQVLLQLARLEHLADNVASPDEFALDVELWDRRPVRIFLDAVSERVVGQHVDALVGDAEIVEDLDDLAGESALRKLRGSLHEENDVVGLDFIVDEFVDAGHCSILSERAAREGLPR